MVSGWEAEQKRHVVSNQAQGGQTDDVSLCRSGLEHMYFLLHVRNLQTAVACDAVVAGCINVSHLPETAERMFDRACMDHLQHHCLMCKCCHQPTISWPSLQ